MHMHKNVNVVRYQLYFMSCGETYKSQWIKLHMTERCLEFFLHLPQFLK